MSTLKNRVAQRATGQRQTGKDIEVKAKVRTARQLFQQMRPQFQMALPKHLAVDRFLRMALTCVQKNPKLLDCTQESLLAALLEPAASLREAEARRDHTARLAWMEESKTLPFAAVWREYCLRQSVPAGPEWINEIISYEVTVLSKRV